MLPSIPSWKTWCVYSTAVPLSSADTVDSSDTTTDGLYVKWKGLCG